ncbi:MAG: hypothetical protein ACREB2_12605 [Pseudolabrys sp.]
MLRILGVLSLLPLLLLAGPANAATKEQKMETCKFGADDQKLTDAKRKRFIINCMANRNDKRGPVPMKPVKKKPMAKKPAAPKPMQAAPTASPPPDTMAPAPK